jgi:rod shape-determining protein MreB
MSLIKRWQPLIGLDLGSEVVRVWRPDQEVETEANLLALDGQNKVLQVGNEALKLMGQAQSSVKLISPIQSGVLSDDEALLSLLKSLLAKNSQRGSLFRPVIMASVSGLTRPAVREELSRVLYQLGAKEVILINQLLAAAIGAGVPIADPSGSFVFHLGAGGAEVGVISLSKTIHHQTSHHGSNYVRDKIFWELKKEYLLEVGDETTMSLLKNELVIGDKEKEKKKGKIVVSGKDLRTNRPVEIEIDHQVLQKVALEVARDYLSLVQNLLKEVPPDLSYNLVEKGILLSGGAAQIQGLDKYLASELGFPATSLDEPENLVILGIKEVMKNLEQFRQYLGMS